MSLHSNSAKRAINKLQSSSLRLMRTIETGSFQPAYIANCKQSIAGNKAQIEKLKAQYLS